MEKTNANPWTILLNDGGMRSVVAASKYHETYRLLSVFVHDGRAVDALSLDAVKLQHEQFGIAKLVELLMPHLNAPTGKSAAGNPHPLRWQQLLLAAGSVASQFNAERIIWPVQIGSDLDKLTQVHETLLMIQQIIRLEVKRPLTIETPFIDLSDRQLVEIGHQMNVHWEATRSCMHKSNDPCGTCRGCARRRQAFTKAGITDPLMAVRRV